MYLTLWTRPASATRLTRSDFIYASYRLNLLLPKGQICVDLAILVLFTERLDIVDIPYCLRPYLYLTVVLINSCQVFISFFNENESKPHFHLVV